MEDGDPWYTVHKHAGLVDAYLFTGNKEALQVVKGWPIGPITLLHTCRIPPAKCHAVIRWNE